MATKNEGVSVARNGVPPKAGWNLGNDPNLLRPPLFLKGMLKVEHEEGVIEVRAGQAVICQPGEWVRYSSPEGDGAEYVAICIPAFSPDTVHRDPE